MRVTRLSRAVRASKLRENPITIYTDSVTPDVFDPSWAFSDASLMTVDWGDGTPIEFHATGLSHTYAAAGRKTVKFYCPDWAKVILFRIINHFCSLAFPSMANLTGLKNIDVDSNNFTEYIPDISNCVGMLNYFAHYNQFSNYKVGEFTTQALLGTIHLAVNNLSQIAVDAILHDCVLSLALPGRVPCILFLNGVGNAPPSNPAGLADKATLVAAWGAGNVLTN